MFNLFYGIFYILATVIDYFAGTAPIFILLLALGLLLPALAVTVRRLHDIGKSGWWYFISWVPLAGGIILLVFLCLDSVGDNQYGPNPKYPDPNSYNPNVNNTF
ncbi:DUF805 domain-containing protein [Paenibacillus pini]|uniref:Integral membrane protein n=2 Tax=Paenibacillus TaxID=44249 RepID=W7YNX6_9BACL|nr:integral membrane protein [Paenibacillus pini JCM 16418]